LPDPRVRVGRVNPIGLKPDPTITLFKIFDNLTKSNFAINLKSIVFSLIIEKYNKEKGIEELNKSIIRENNRLR